VIARFLGVPPEDRRLLFSASNRLLGFEDAEYGTNEDDGRQAAMELATLAYRIAEARKAAPQDDIVTILLNAEVDGLRLSDVDFIAFFVLLTIAGNETTRNQTSHTLRLLLEHPDELAKLRADASLLNSAVEEALRFSPPVMPSGAPPRPTPSSAASRSHRVLRGDLHPSANRDEDVFPDADRFDIRGRPTSTRLRRREHFARAQPGSAAWLPVAVGETSVASARSSSTARSTCAHFIDGVNTCPSKSPTQARRPEIGSRVGDQYGTLVARAGAAAGGAGAAWGHARGRLPPSRPGQVCAGGREAIQPTEPTPPRIRRCSPSTVDRSCA
jgi:hypothetical protein